MDPYKQIVDEWLEEAPYSALRILEKLREMGFDGGYSIVKAYVSSRKMDLNEKASPRRRATRRPPAPASERRDICTPRR
ncbi:hypothetical protein [uncultured Alistipes sp.]|uniref:hypothetical protein n=1 Tax=uncultured Alistipes sp. TaxID=538949 RepID=UPI003220225D